MTKADEIFTHSSELDLVRHIAAQIMEVAAQWRRDHWFFLGSKRALSLPTLPLGWEWSDPEAATQQTAREIKHAGIGSRALSPYWRAPALAGQVRVRWVPHPRRPKNTPSYLLVDFQQYTRVAEDERQLAAQIPPLVDPLREDYESWDTWQAAVQANVLAWEARYGQHARAVRGVLQSLWVAQKRIAVQVWLDHAHNPYKGIRRIPGERKKRLDLG